MTLKKSIMVIALAAMVIFAAAIIVLTGRSPKPPLMEPAGEIGSARDSIGDDEFSGEIIEYPVRRVAPSLDRFFIIIELPGTMKFNDKAPFVLEVSGDGEASVKIGEFDYSTARRRLGVPIELTPGRAILTVTTFFSYCGRVDESMCFFKNLKLEIPLEIVEGGNSGLEIVYEVKE